MGVRPRWRWRKSKPGKGERWRYRRIEGGKGRERGKREGREGERLWVKGLVGWLVLASRCSAFVISESCPSEGRVPDTLMLLILIRIVIIIVLVPPPPTLVVTIVITYYFHFYRDPRKGIKKENCYRSKQSPQ